jgi:hypothetical protein
MREDIQTGTSPKLALQRYLFIFYLHYDAYPAILTADHATFKSGIEDTRRASAGVARRFTPHERKFMGETCFRIASQYVGLFVMGQNPYRLIKLNRHSTKLTKELIADIVLHESVEGDVGAILKVCASLPVAMTMLRHQKGTFGLEDIVKVAYTYSVGKTEGVL